MLHLPTCTMPPTDFIPTPPSPSNPGSFPPLSSIPIAPPPWALKAKSWTFLYSDIERTTSPPQNPNNTPSILQSILPPGAYHPYETVHTSALQTLSNGNSQFQKGWLKAIMIVRYEDTDVGPYDELMLFPGWAVNPNTGKKDMRISTIYVSTDASVWNGRRNWNIPKHRARFEFKPVGKSDLSLKVYHPENSPAPLNPNLPFFTALLKGSSLPKVPLPHMAPLPLVQPPLSKSRWPPGIQDAVIATDDPENGRENPWLRINPAFKGSWGLAYPRRLEDGEDTLQWHGDGVGFPKLKLWSVGSVFEGRIEFGVSTVVS
ncbi:hypothetical protein BDW59DRAFT_182183 [Aspergillus cavernicola]|uniref:Acetoacetate decarboxylase n=1 Tax=Aspergillus cavernicola TaxID=176166 RepID=A0ABR4IUW5_9EURO